MAKKLFYKIGEACKQLDIQPYVLRYWETEFDMLSPEKSKSGQRTYNEDDLRVIQRIKELLYDEGYTIAGAKKKLEAELAGDPPATSGAPPKAASASDSTAAGATAATLDSEAEKRIETLRDGLRDSLREARELLEMLEKPQPES